MRLRFIEDDGQFLSLETVGPITYDDIKPDQDPFIDAVGEDVYSRKVLLDGHRSIIVESPGIGWLLSSHKQFTQHGGKLVIHSLPEVVVDTLRILKLDEKLHLADGQEAARQLAGS